MKEQSRYTSIDYLRGFLTVLVVLHHVMLSYTNHRIGVMIDDPAKWIGADIITGYIEMFFMSLFFLVSGLFALRSIEKKGIGTFIKERIMRLGLPFAIGFLVINVPALYISAGAYSQYFEGIPMSLGWFLKFWGEALRELAAGPLWFLWVLLVFNLVIALIYKLVPNLCDKIRGSKAKWLERPWAFVLALLGVGIVCYLPLSQVGDNSFVHLFGPFALQVSRVLLYLLFFTVGAVIGVYGLEKSVLGKQSKLTQRWWILLLVSIPFFIFLYFMFFAVLNGQVAGWWTNIIVSVLFVSVCVTGCIWVFGAFTRHARIENVLMRGLSRNAYGMYIFHFSVVTALQYAFLEPKMHGAAKGALVFALSLVCTWAIVWLLRRIPAVRKVIG